MAKQRLVNTKFWSDGWVVNLDPIEKLLFLYLLTNERTNICGVYELPVKYMAVETGIDKDMVEKVLKRFTKDKKIYFIKGWVVIKNFIKNQNQGSPKVKAGIEAELSKIPAEILDKIKELDTLSKGIDTLSHLNLNSNLNSNSNLNIEIGDKSPSPSKSIFYLREIPEEDIKYFIQRFDLNSKELKSKAESLSLYCEAKGRKYKDYRAFLLNALKKDFQERRPEVKLPDDDISPEQRERNIKELAKIKKDMFK